MSKRLDDELAEALREKESESEGAGSPSVVGGTGDDGGGFARNPAGVAQPPKRRNLGLLVTLIVMVGGLLALVFLGFSNSAVYAVTVDKLTTEKQLEGRKVRVEGELVPGTLAKREKPCEYRFTIHGGKSELPVRYAQCVIPDTFRDVPSGGVQVTVEGSFDNGNFEASLVMAKCASKYDPKTHEMQVDKSALR